MSDDPGKIDIPIWFMLLLVPVVLFSMACQFLGDVWSWIFGG